MSAPAPAVLLHGSPTCAALWGRLRSEVAQPTWAPDLPGYGTAPPLPLPRHGVADHLEWLDRAREAQGLPEWSALHLVGTDYGALLAGRIAVERGARSLTVVSGALGVAWAGAKITAAPVLRGPFYRTYAGARWMGMAARGPAKDDFLREVGGALLDPHLPQRMERTALGIPLRHTATLPLRLRATGTPTLLVWGAHDQNYPLAQARLLAAILGAPLRVLPGAGHALPFEQPEALARVLRTFWRQT